MIGLSGAYTRLELLINYRLSRAVNRDNQ